MWRRCNYLISLEASRWQVHFLNFNVGHCWGGESAAIIRPTPPHLRFPPDKEIATKVEAFAQRIHIHPKVNCISAPGKEGKVEFPIQPWEFLSFCW